MWSRAEVSPCSQLCPCFLPLLCRGPGMSPCHSTTYSPKPLLTEGSSPPAEHTDQGRCQAMLLLSHLMPAGSPAGSPRSEALWPPILSPSLLLCKTCSGTWLPFPNTGEPSLPAQGYHQTPAPGKSWGKRAKHSRFLGPHAVLATRLPPHWA